MLADLGLDRYGVTTGSQRQYPILAKPGRPSRSITNEEISAVIAGLENPRGRE